MPRAARHRHATTVLAGLLAIVALAGCASARPGRPIAVAPPESLPASQISHVVVMLLENREYDDVLGPTHATSFLARLAARHALATGAHGVSHPSLPNYLALTGGSTFGITSDCTDCSVSATNLVDQLEGAHVSWKAYMEDLPRPCFAGAASAGYAKKHDPFLYYRDVAGNRARCQRVVGFSQLAADLRAGSLPGFAWISPNLCDDGHDCPTDQADRFTAGLVPSLLAELGPQGFLVITWDEGSSDAGCCGGAHGGRVATILAGPGARAGARSSVPSDHYSILRTVEDAFGLAHLGQAACPCTPSLDGLLNPGATHPAAAARVSPVPAR